MSPFHYDYVCFINDYEANSLVNLLRLVNIITINELNLKIINVIPVVE